MLRVHLSILLSFWNNNCILFDRMKNLDGYVHNLKKRQILHARRRRKMETPKSIKVCLSISLPYRYSIPMITPFDSF